MSGMACGDRELLGNFCNFLGSCGFNYSDFSHLGSYLIQMGFFKGFSEITVVEVSA